MSSSFDLLCQQSFDGLHAEGAKSVRSHDGLQVLMLYGTRVEPREPGCKTCIGSELCSKRQQHVLFWWMTSHMSACRQEGFQIFPRCLQCFLHEDTATACKILKEQNNRSNTVVPLACHLIAYFGHQLQRRLLPYRPAFGLCGLSLGNMGVTLWRALLRHG